MFFIVRTHVLSCAVPVRPCGSVQGVAPRLRPPVS